MAVHSGCWATASRVRKLDGGKTTTLARWHQVHDLLDAGVGLLECARRLNLTLNTIKRYARIAEPEKMRRAPQYRPTLVDPYREYLRKRRAEDPAVPVLQLLREIRERGYTGSQNLLYRYITQGRVEDDRPALSPRRLSRFVDTGFVRAAPTTTFRLGLTERGLAYVMAVKATTSAYPADAVPHTPPYSGRGRPPGPRYPAAPSTLGDLVLDAGRRALRQVTWRQGSKKTKGNLTAKMGPRFTAIRVRPANRDIPRADDGSLPECWLLAEWPPGEPEPTDYWLSTLPATTPIKTLVRLAKIRWRIEHDYRELKTGLGLTHFEGRSWTGWHRHVTLASAAHLFLTELRLTSPKVAGAA
ncbi:hypothetical protein GCM10029978_063490 [Actinoallomurus acanthiterrae]